MASLTKKYFELSVKSHHSFLEGSSSPEDLMLRAQDLGLPGIALTDRNGVYGIPRAYNRAKDFPNFKLITGAEIHLVGKPPITLICKTKSGYGLMCKLITEAHKVGKKGEAFLSESKALQILTEERAEGLFALLDPAGDPVLPKTDLLEELGLQTFSDLDLSRNLNFINKNGSESDLLTNALAQDPEKNSPTNYEPDSLQYNWIDWRKIFKDRLYLKIYRFLDGFDETRISKVTKIAQHFDLPTVVTNEVLFHHPSKKPLQDVLTVTRLNTTLKDAGRSLLKNQERHLKSAEQMYELFPDFTESIENSVRIAEQVEFCPSQLRYYYPSEWIPKGYTAQSFLEEITLSGANFRYPAGVPFDVQKQLRHELQLIQQLNFADYFLTIWDIVEFAKKRKILCQGRGSAANSVICYCLGITSIDPVRMNLLFERFLSQERNEPPDIDVDFEHERREEVLQYVYEKYGRHRAAMVCTNITYRTRSALRDVGKAMGIELSKRDIEIRRETGKSFSREEEFFLNLVRQIKGAPRHLSIHTGGFTLSGEELTNIVPIEPATMDGRTVIQWDKYDLDILGLLKVDLLSLGMLTAIRKTFDFLENRITMATVPAEDPNTYQMIQKGNTVGVFQIESRAQMNMLGRLQPETFYDLVIQVAIVRPGPIVGQMVHPYLKRRRGIEKIEYHHPKLKAILEKTLGVPLFQEQVMKMAIDLAGFSPGEADQLRRAIGAWRASGSIEVVGKRLREGFLKSGLPKEFIDRIFEQIKGFAEYGFPESHAASFALITYVSCYLKCHYPAEFTAALVNSQPLGFYSNNTLIHDAKRHGIKVHALDIHKSFWDCGVFNKEITLGFRIVHGLQKGHYEQLVKEREKRPFQNLFDFFHRTSLSPQVLERLALAGAFTCFGFSERESLWMILEFHSMLSGHKNKTQLSLFEGLGTESPNAMDLNIETKPMQPSVQWGKLDEYSRIAADFEAYQLTPKTHPMKLLREKIKSLPQNTAISFRTQKHGIKIKAAGLVIVRQRPHTAKGVVFATLEDETGFVDLILRESEFKKHKDLFNTQSFLVVTGILQRDRLSCSVLVKDVKPLWSEDSHYQLLNLKSHNYH